jgi:hypothetical protein
LEMLASWLATPKLANEPFSDIVAKLASLFTR